MLFADEDQAAKATRDPVAPGTREIHSHLLPDGSTVHSFRTLLQDLSTIVRNTCRTPGPVERSGTFNLATAPTSSQRRALELIEKIAA